MATMVLGSIGTLARVSGPWGIALNIAGAIVGGMIDRSLFQDRSVNGDVKPSGSSYGTAIPRVYGCARPGQANVIWGTPTFTKHSHSGGKGGPPGADTYTWSFLVLVCERLTQGETIRRIWGQDVLLYDAEASTPTKDTIRIHYGEDDQDPDSFIAAHVSANPDLYDVAATPAYRGVLTVMFEELDLSQWGNYPPQLTFEIYKADGVELRYILSDLTGLVGLDDADCEFDAATAVVQGFIAANREPIRSTVEPLLMVFATDLAEYDGKLWAVPRGSTNAIPISSDDLGARSDGSDEAQTNYSLVRTPDLELPKRLDFTYSSFTPISSDSGTERPTYESGTQFAVRHSKDLVSESQTLQTMITMTDDDARQVAERLVYTIWMERLVASIAVPPKYLTAVPAAILSCSLAGRTYRLRARTVDVGLFGELRIEAVPDSLSVLEQSAAGASKTGGTDGEHGGTDPVSSTFAAWSGIDVRDEDTLQPGFYVAATGGTDWTGGTIYWSSDGGTTWTRAGFIADRSMIGTAVGALADGSAAETWESGSSVTVDLNAKAAPQTAAREEVWNGSNLMLLGNEVIGYSTVAAASGNWLLSDLLRGLRGSSMSGHTIGERAIGLNSSSLSRVNVREDLIGATIQVKVVSSGQAISDVTAVDVVIAQNSPVYAYAAETSADGWSRILALMGV